MSKDNGRLVCAIAVVVSFAALVVAVATLRVVSVAEGELLASWLAYVLNIALPIVIGFLAYVLSPRLRQYLVGPRLELTLASPKGEVTFCGGPGGRPVRYYHVDVKNKRPWSPAKGTEIRIEGLAKKGHDGQFRELSVQPLQLHWQFPDGEKKREPVQVNYYDRCDIGCVDDMESRRAKSLPEAHGNERVFLLSVYIWPNNFRGFVFPGQSMRIRVVASAENFVGQPVVFEVGWEPHPGEEPQADREYPILQQVASLTP